jgi:hypothetical protein
MSTGRRPTTGPAQVDRGLAADDAQTIAWLLWDVAASP